MFCLENYFQQNVFFIVRVIVNQNLWERNKVDRWNYFYWLIMVITLFYFISNLLFLQLFYINWINYFLPCLSNSISSLLYFTFQFFFRLFLGWWRRCGNDKRRRRRRRGRGGNNSRTDRSKQQKIIIKLNFISICFLSLLFFY